jgi:hypothetical protein
MNLQRVLLRLMLATLGIAAAVGVIAIFLSTSVTGRVAGTALVSSICIGIAIPVSRLMDATKQRWAGLIGLGSIVVAFALFVLGIWSDLVVAGDTPWKLVGTGVVILLGGVLCANVIPRIGVRGFTIACITAVAFIVTAMAFFMTAIWWDGWEMSEKLLLSANLSLGTGLILSLSLIGLGDSMRWWQWLGVLGGVVSCVLGFLGIWVTDSDDTTFFAAFVSLGVVVGHANVILRVKTGEHGLWAKLPAIGGTAISGICVTLLTAITRLMGEHEPDMLIRLLAASGLVAATSTMAVVVMHVMHRRAAGVRSAEAGDMPSDAPVSLVCPSCAKKLTVNAGKESACTGCGLLISLAIKTPHCEKCDYTLLAVAGDKCPECGHPR